VSTSLHPRQLAARFPLNLTPLVFQPALAKPRQSQENTLIHDHHWPLTIDEPLRVVSNVGIHAADPGNLDPDEAVALRRLVSRWTVWMTLDQALLNRLFTLWNALLQISADEIGDWSLQAVCEIVAADGVKPPDVLSVAASVYANGELSFALTLEGIDPVLWFVDILDLTDLERPPVGVPPQRVPS
jgi:hypothetical protein